MEQIPQQPPFLKRIFRRPPLVFPFVLLFHIVVLVFNIKPYILEGGLLAGGGLIALTWSLIYVILWIFICDMRKWAATAYMVFTAINLLLQFLLIKTPLWHDAGLTLFPVDVLMTVFLLFYYKRFE